MLRFGFTNTNPEDFRHDMPKYACPDRKFHLDCVLFGLLLTSKNLVTNKPGNWAKALTERYCLQNNVLHFYVQESGEVLYGVNGVQKGLFLTGLDTSRPLWIVVDIYGNTLAVEFLGLKYTS